MTIKERIIANLRSLGMYESEEIQAVISLTKQKDIFAWEEDAERMPVSCEIAWKETQVVAQGYLLRHNPGSIALPFLDCLIMFDG